MTFSFVNETKREIKPNIFQYHNFIEIKIHLLITNISPYLSTHHTVPTHNP